MKTPHQFRVNLLAHGELFGGAEQQILTLAAGLVNQGSEVLLSLFFDSDLAERCRAERIPFEILGVRHLIRPRSRFDSSPGTPIYHAHNPRGTFLSARRHDHRSILIRTEHGRDSSDPDTPLRPRMVRMAEEAALFRCGATMVYVSTDLLQWRSRRIALLPHHIIPNGDDLPDKHNVAIPKEFRSDRFNVVFAGRLTSVKNPMAAIQAMKLLPSSSKAHLYMLGSGDLEQQVRQSVADDIGRARISLMGFRTDARSFIAHADAVILPSIHEGLPFTAIEALGFAVPLIASEVGGLKENLCHRSTAIFIAPDSAQSAADAILELENAPELCRSLGEQGQHLQRSRLSASRMVEKYLALYASLSAAKRATLNRNQPAPSDS